MPFLLFLFAMTLVMGANAVSGGGLPFAGLTALMACFTAYWYWVLVDEDRKRDKLHASPGSATNAQLEALSELAYPGCSMPENVGGLSYYEATQLAQRLTRERAVLNVQAAAGVVETASARQPLLQTTPRMPAGHVAGC